MEVILSQHCKSLTGTIGGRFGYYIRSTKTGRFFSQRSKHSVPPDGHWQFIVSCAEIAKLNLHIADISVTGEEIEKALVEAGLLHRTAHRLDSWKKYNAAEVLQFKNESGL